MKPNEVLSCRRVALLIIDMINTFDFPQGADLARLALPVAKKIQKLKVRLRKHRIPVIYLNDNFGQWRSDWKEVFNLCTQSDCLGKDIAEILHPADDDFFILKPRHSGFFNTNLDVLLKELGVQKLIITGVAGNICVLFTANDAHMRDFKVWIPQDCVASNTKKENVGALTQMKTVLDVSISASHEVRNSHI
ncbi:Isochorismatase [Bdellovibrio bacteriovorus str. Tiberius]|uniref:Isochorismatase n=2 Tax=Bdellovibrio bacteriovorus TaxID=959 RepID=K7ZFX6_BDEBC|nr:Isochorismatase [Bdellovibrio bacteriovorus str. Tiberius]